MDVVSLLDKIGVIFESHGYLIIFFSSLFEITPLGWAIPGGAILAIGGYLANGGDKINLIPVIISGTLGTLLAFNIAYLLGSKTGMWLVKKLKQEKTARFAKSLLSKNGGVILTTSMLANLTRFWISYIAGVDGYKFLKFNVYAFTASLTWVSLVTILGYFAGYERLVLRQMISGIGYFAWVLLIVAVFIIYKSILKEYKQFKKDEPTIENENN